MRLLLLFCLALLACAKQYVVVDDIKQGGPIEIRFFDVSVDPPTQKGAYALPTKETGEYREGCVLSKMNRLFVVTNQFNDKTHYTLHSIDVKTLKEVKSYSFTLQHPYAAIKCDEVSNMIVIMQPLLSQVDTVMFSTIDPTSGHVQSVVNVTEKGHPHEFWLDAQTYDSKTHTFVWQWIWKKGPLEGDLTFVDIKTKKVNKLHYNIGYQELESVTYDSSAGMVYGTNTSNAALHVNLDGSVTTKKSDSEPDQRIIWVQALVGWDVKTNKWGNIGKLKRLLNYGPWDVGAVLSPDGKSYNNWGRNSSTTATHFNWWDLKTGDLKISGPAPFSIGPLRWFQWADLDM
eukprot:TRINITY_DN93624_c0_g1_i1.p1 TRINITY_DN93624_c0_g1~~TRINITY_DN93624_c0_g1_i1.p1  ORF type:complete len:345 (+),score=45.26 TRINITY_DN93624_c0_g1_i1:16-1050(+)